MNPIPLPDMSSFLAHFHADLRRARLTRRGATHHPKDVPMGLHKAYVRMEKIPLPAPAPLDCTLQNALVRRRSTGDAGTGAPLTLKDLGTLFGSALRRHAEGIRRMYPSGGGLYPVETYLIATQTDGLTPGVFHYNPTIHALTRLCALPREFDMKRLVYKPDFLNPSALIVFTGVWKRSSAKYGDLSYLHAVLEAGHMSENVLLVATALDLETRPYAGFDDELIARILDLDEESEQPVHAITLSKSSKTQSARNEQTPSEE